MEDLREEREWEKYSSAPVEEIDNGSWVWNKGLGLGKKIVISGIVISSAPLILPPLFAVSALGLALSIPCGFLFATYASTRILMNYLLPTLDPSQLSDDENNFDDGDDVKEQLSFEGNIKVGGYNEDENADKHKDNLEVEQVIKVVDTNEMNKESEKISDVEEGGKMEEDTKDLKDEDVEKTNKETIKKSEKPSVSKKKKVNKQTGAKKKDTETTNGKAVKPVEESRAAEKKVIGKDLDRKDESAVNKGAMATSEGSESSPSDDMKSTNTADHPALVSVLPRSSYGKGTTRRSDKVIYSEAEMWENIGVLRKIVGYKVEPQTKITEELKAIYQYTGVEPPGSFKDGSSLVDLDDKIRFLMSIVGVKVD